MKFNYLIILMLVGLLIMPLVAAEASYTIKQNELTDLKIPVFDENNVPVNGSTTCFLTVSNKNDGYIVNNQQMTNGTGGIYNYSLTIASLGDSYGSMSCSDGVTSGFSTFVVEVTPTGERFNPNFYYLIFIVSLGVIIFGFWIKDGWVVVLGTIGLYFLGLYILLNGLNGVKDGVYTWAVGIILLAIAAYISIKSTYEMIQDDGSYN